jgi:hypothetical protein
MLGTWYPTGSLQVVNTLSKVLPLRAGLHQNSALITIITKGRDLHPHFRDRETEDEVTCSGSLR